MGTNGELTENVFGAAKYSVPGGALTLGGATGKLARMMRLVTVSALALCLLQCSKTAQSGWETTDDTKGTGSTVDATDALTAAEAAWSERSDLQKLEQAIASFTDAAKADPKNHEIWTKLSRAHYFKGDCHMRFSAGEPEMQTAFENGKVAAERALVALSPEFGELMKSGKPVEDGLPLLDKRAVPALYWRSSSLGKWASIDGFATLLSYKDEVRAVMGRCLELDSKYYHHGPNRYFGVFYARAPGYAGGDMDKSKEHFDASLTAAPYYMGTRVLMAQDYAVKKQDADLFDSLLKEVLEGDVNTVPEVAPENRCEQQKAKALQATRDESF